MAAQDAELKLRVSLDLAYFKGQLPLLSKEAAGHPLTFGVRFNRDDIATQFRTLDRYIGRKKFNIEINTNLKTELDRARKLTEAIKAIPKGGGSAGAIGTVQPGFSQARLKQINPEQIKKLYRAAADAGLVSFDQSIASNKEKIARSLSQVGKDSVTGLLNGMKSGDAQVSAAAKSLGASLITSIKGVLGIASPSRVFKALGEFSADGLEIGFLNGLKDFKVKAVGEIRQIVALMKFELAKVSDLSGAGGPPAGLLRRQLVGQRAYTSPIGPLPHGSRAPWAMGESGYEPRMVSRPYGQAYPAAPGSFLAFSRQAGQVPSGGGAPAGRTPGNFLQFPMDRRLAIGGPSAMAQSVAGPTPWFNTSRGALGGYNPGVRSSAFFPMNGMMGPSSPLGRITAQSSMFAGGGAGGGGGGRPPFGGGGGGMGGLGGQFGRAMASIQLPGAGVVRELGSEFGMATKQVLLFGTAYKALAFATSFPAQVGQAVGALQSFNNTLKAISPSAQEARASNELILGLVNRYNTPLQSARDGFTKLYASMAPAGFSGDEVRNLFTGISKAAATFGMSADKVDRVNYAFAQMASKGQVMSEELKGQLGDVLPGAMGIFAEAAGFKGPDAIQKFSKSLEDGVYQGEAMKTLLTNVGIIFNQEFGPGAEGAARTFQGLMNRMQNSMVLLYESFEPVAVGFLNGVVMPLTTGIKTLTDGFNAFFTGARAQTAGGFALSQELEKLRPAFAGIQSNIATLLPVLQSFGQVVLDISKVFLQIAGNPLAGYLARLYAIALPINMLLGVMRGLWAANALQLLIFNARVATGTSTLTAFRGMMAATGATAATTATAIRTAGITLRTFFATTGVGLVIVGISMLIERFMSMNQALEDTKNKALGAAQAIRSMTSTEARAEEQRSTRAIKLIETLQNRKRSYEGSEDVGVSSSEASLLESMGVPVQQGLGGGRYVKPDMLESYKQRIQTVNLAGAQSRQQQVVFEEKQATEQSVLQPITPEGGKGSDADAKKASDDANRFAAEAQRRAIDAANLQNSLDKARYEGLAALGDQAFQHAITLIDARNNYELAGLDSIASRQEKFQQDLQKIELDRINTVRQATQKAVEASLKFAAAKNTAAAAGAGRVQGASTGLFQGSTGISSGPHFDVRRADGGIISEAEARALFSEDVRRQLTMTSGYGPRRAPAPGASTFHRGIDLAGPANTPLSLAPGYSLMGVGQEGGLGYAASVQGPQGQSYKVGHLQKPGAGYTMQRREAKAGGNLQVEQLERSNALEAASLVAINATTEALAKREALIASNINTIFPVAEQRLQNDLTKIRNDLQLKGMPQEYIDYQEESYKASYEMSEAIKKNEEDTKKYQQTVDALQAKKAKGVALTEGETNALTFYTEAIVQNEKALDSLTKQQVEYNIAALEGAIAAMKNADAIKAQQETMDLIKGSVESASNSYKGFIKEVATGGDPSEALKKFQEAITDQALTIFLDFAMKPVEDFFKQQLSGIFGVPTEEEARGEAMAALEAKLEEQRALQANIDRNVQTIATSGAGGTAQAQSASAAFSPAGGLSAAFDAGSVFGGGAISGGIFDTIAEQMNGATESFESFSSHMSQFVDSSIASSESLGTWTNDGLKNLTAKTNEEGGKWQESLGKTVSAIGVAAGTIMGIAAGVGQIKKGGTSNVLAGIGSIFMSVGGAIGGIMNLGKAANGAVWTGGFQAFANGGTVSGPTLGLIGEGKYNEAIVPLPDGRSIPVQMRGQTSSRDLLAASAAASSAPSLSMNFQTTTINGTEYVSREQLEQAMMETRKLASRDGAQRGANLAIDRLQQSPNVRRRVGIR